MSYVILTESTAYFVTFDSICLIKVAVFISNDQNIYSHAFQTRCVILTLNVRMASRASRIICEFAHYLSFHKGSLQNAV